MFRLLEGLRKIPEVSDCYTFGATLHVAVKPGFIPQIALERLSAMGINNVSIYPAKGEIEDLFIKLARNDKQ